MDGICGTWHTTTTAESVVTTNNGASIYEDLSHIMQMVAADGVTP